MNQLIDIDQAKTPCFARTDDTSLGTYGGQNKVDFERARAAIEIAVPGLLI